MRQITTLQFEKLLLASTPLIDVRAPIEFQTGSIPGAINLPLLVDSERREVGITYKNQGQDAAIKLGHQLVSGPIKEERLSAWFNQSKKQPNTVIYCYRGGLRSQTVQTWLKEKHLDIPIVEGGYKALRTYLMQTLESLIMSLKFQVVCGPTGSGKTTYLNSNGQPSIDLEGLAKHRGSAFGALTEPQPSQIDFENNLALALLRLKDCKESILIENESLMIGHRMIPAVLYAKMQISPKQSLEVPIDERVENILKEYILNSKLTTHQDPQRFEEFRSSIRAISRKLGGLRTTELLNDIQISQDEFESAKTFNSNKIWIKKLLEWYYDPNYKYSFQKKENKKN